MLTYLHYIINITYLHYIINITYLHYVINITYLHYMINITYLHYIIRFTILLWNFNLLNLDSIMKVLLRCFVQWFAVCIVIQAPNEECFHNLITFTVVMNCMLVVSPLLHNCSYFVQNIDKSC